MSVESPVLFFFRAVFLGGCDGILKQALSCLCAAALLEGENAARAEQVRTRGMEATASSSEPGFGPAGAIDGDRFSSERTHAWQGAARATNWWWEARFDPPREIGAILQITGDHPFILRDAPRDYVWQWSNDNQDWHDLPTTQTTNEQRTFRLHRLERGKRVAGLRLRITGAQGPVPTLREVEFFSDPGEAVIFPDWIVAVNTTDRPGLPSHGQEFIPLARSCAGWEKLQAQQVWLGSFDEDFIRAEPRPLCAFLSGNFKDWCEVSREPWRGTQEVLRKKNLPLWASCGGAQGLAILAETGVDQAWDCPHCRDPLAPKTPIYTHIGHTGARPCGDYSACVFERGPQQVRQVTSDPVLQGLPAEFSAMESHCGQIEWPPQGWQLIATAGPGTKTKTQCLRLKDRYIYGAQFHIEMEGSPEVSRRLMGNFLTLSKQWGGWNPNGKMEK